MLNEDKKLIMNTYGRIQLEVEKAKGAYIYDTKGDKYLDTYAGIAVNAFGHCDDLTIKAITEQASKYIHLSNYYINKPAIDLAKILVENTFAKQVFYSNSGTESIECALKIAKKYGNSKNSDKNVVLSSWNAFHGRSIGALSLTPKELYQKPFKPLLPHVDHFNFNDIDDLTSKVSDKVCAVFIEPIQGEGGIVPLCPEFVKALVILAKKHDFLIVVDEIQSGIGRTGFKIAIEKYDITPDIVTLSKALGGGLPLGAVLVCEKLENFLIPGEHGTTFGPNPISAAAGLSVVSRIFNDEFLKEVNKKSEYFIKKLEDLKSKYPCIKEIRGFGLMLGIDVGEIANIVKDKAFDKKVLLNVTSGTIIRFLPALNFEYEEFDIIINTLDEIFSELN